MSNLEELKEILSEEKFNEVLFSPSGINEKAQNHVKSLFNTYKIRHIAKIVDGGVHVITYGGRNVILEETLSCEEFLANYRA